MPLYGILSTFIGTNPLPGILLSFFIVSLMAILMVNLNTVLYFINERTFLPAFFYILLSGLFPQYQLMNPAIFGAVFLMLALRRIMDAYRVHGTAFCLFDAAMLISIGSLFYADLIWFGFLVLIGIAIIRTGNMKEIAISVAGLITPYLLTFSIYYVAGKDLQELMTLVMYNLFGRQTDYVFTGPTVIGIIFVAASTVMSIFYLMISMNSKKIQSRMTFSLLIWLFIISIAVYLILTSVSVEIIWITGIPVSYFLTHYFVNAKKKLVPEIIFTLIIGFIVLIQVLYLR